MERDLSDVQEDPNLTRIGFTNLECYVKLPIVVPLNLGPDGLTSADNNAIAQRMSGMKLKFRATASGRLPPYAFVGWINEKIAALITRQWPVQPSQVAAAN